MASHTALDFEHVYLNSFTLYRGCTLSPQVVSSVMPMLIKHLHTSQGVQLGSTTRPLQSIYQPVYAHRGLTVSQNFSYKNSKEGKLMPMDVWEGSPFSPFLKVAHIDGDLLITRPGHTHIGSWLYCEECFKCTMNRSLCYLRKNTHKPL